MHFIAQNYKCRMMPGCGNDSKQTGPLAIIPGVTKVKMGSHSTQERELDDERGGARRSPTSVTTPDLSAPSGVVRSAPAPHGRRTRFGVAARSRTAEAACRKSSTGWAFMVEWPISDGIVAIPRTPAES